MSDITTILADLATQLSAIAPVRVGQAALETTSAALPVIALWSTTDQPLAEQSYRTPAYTRTVVIEAQIAATATFGDALDTMLSAVRRVMQPQIGQAASAKALAIREQNARFFLPAVDSKIAIVQITLEIDYLERF